MRSKNLLIIIGGGLAALIAAILFFSKKFRYFFMTDDEKLDVVLEQILKNEGGYVSNPDDKGGETKFGISKRSYPNEDIKAMTKTRAKQIFLKDYAEPLRSFWAHCTINTIYQIVDSAVNCGVAKTKQLLSRVTADKDFKQVRREFYESIAIGSQLQFLKGWLKRVDVKI